MKKSKKTLALLVSLYVVAISAVAGSGERISETKEAKVSLKTSNNPDIEIDGKDTQLDISSWGQDKIEIIARVEFKGEETDETREFLDNFQEIVEKGISQNGDIFKISTILDEPNKVEMGTKLFNFITISYSEKELNTTYEIKLPINADIEIKNSYEDFSMKGNFDGKVSVDHYSGEFTGGNFSQLLLTMKYGEASIESVKEGRFEFYEQELEIGDLEKAEITAKYSEITVQNGGIIDFDDYETNYIIENIEQLTGDLKYGSIEIEQLANKIKLGKIYEVEIEGQKIKSLIIEESKYCTFDYEAGELFNIETSYEDDISISTLIDGQLDGKYIKIELDTLKGNFIVQEGYEMEVKFVNIPANEGEIKIDGKYITVKATNVSGGLSFVLRANYGNLNYNKSDFIKNLYEKDGSKLTVELEKGQSPRKTISIGGYEVNVFL